MMLVQIIIIFPAKLPDSSMVILQAEMWGADDRYVLLVKYASCLHSFARKPAPQVVKSYSTFLQCLLGGCDARIKASAP